MALPILRRGGSPVSTRPTDGTAQAFSRVDPWNDLAVMDRLFSSMFDGLLSPAFTPVGRTLAPALSGAPAEFYETGDDLLAYLYVPGLSAEAFDISASGDTLTIKGERKPLLEVTEGLISHTPNSGFTTGSGTFQASYNLPVEIDPAKVEASYREGVPHIRLPKHETAKPKQVKVQVSGN